MGKVVRDLRLKFRVQINNHGAQNNKLSIIEVLIADNNIQLLKIYKSLMKNLKKKWRN